MTDLVIREYRPDDRDRVIALARQLQAKEASLYDRMKPPETIDGWYMDHMLAACAKAKGRIFIVEAGGTAIGYAVLLGELSSADEFDEIDYTYAQVKDLAVDEAHRRRGIGQALLDHCEKTARDAGVRWLRLTVLTENDAARLYEKAGFKSMVMAMEKTLE